MTLRKKRQLLQWTTGLIGAAAVVLVLLGVLLPVHVEPPQQDEAQNTANTGPDTTAQNTRQPTQVQLQSLKKLAALNWRRDLFPAPGTEDDFPLADDGSGLPLSIKLLGVAHEPGHSMALFIKPDGAVEICPLGQTINDPGGKVKVTQIDTDRVTIVYQGASSILRVPAPDSTEATGALGSSAAGTPGKPGSPTTTARATTNIPGTGTPNTPQARRRPLPPEVERRINEARRKAGLPPLPPSNPAPVTPATTTTTDTPAADSSATSPAGAAPVSQDVSDAPVTPEKQPLPSTDAPVTPAPPAQPTSAATPMRPSHLYAPLTTMHGDSHS